MCVVVNHTHDVMSCELQLHVMPRRLIHDNAEYARVSGSRKKIKCKLIQGCMTIIIKDGVSLHVHFKALLF